MPYILTKTNGTTLTTVDDASLDTTTDLFLVGRNYSGYGNPVNENFIKLLENFNNATPPSKPLQGELWFNSSSKTLNVCYDGANFKGLANLFVQTTTPQSSAVGDFWWNSQSQQLYGYNGSNYTLIGPTVSATASASWVSSNETSISDVSHLIPVLKAQVGSSPVVTISNNDEFVPQTSSSLNGNFSNGVQKGITLAGADANGSTRANNYYFWGTAAEALVAVTATTATNINITSTASGTYYLPFASVSNSSAPLKGSSALSYNAATNVLNTTATSATYADLAERYAADKFYSIGSVVVIGGDAEITSTNKHGDTRVAGIISQNPAYMMNADAGDDRTHPYVALRGRVLCKVTGLINKGDLLVSSTFPEHAEAFKPGDDPNAVVGKALEDHIGYSSMIEVLV